MFYSLPFRVRPFYFISAGYDILSSLFISFIMGNMPSTSRSRLESQPHSFSVVYLGVPHTASCGRFIHLCGAAEGPTGRDAALPRLHRLTDFSEVYRYPHEHKYFGGMDVWVDGWGRVKLVERNLGVPDMRYYACVGGGGVVVGWVTVPASATLMRSWGDGPVVGRPRSLRSF